MRRTAVARLQSIIRWLFLSLVLLVSLGSLTPSHAQSPPLRGPIYTVQVEGVITAVTIDYLRRAVQLAETSNASAIVFTLAIEGGVLSDVRLFARDLVAAKTPVVVFIAPSGTQTGAAGAILISAAHLNAMAPDTSFGSPFPLARVDATLSQQTQNLMLDSLASQLRGWNGDRGRNTDWVDQAVREGLILNNEQAFNLDPPALNLIAANQEQLFTQLDGRIVRLADGSEVQIAALSRTPTAITPTLWEQLRMLLATPTVAFALLILGALAIYLEFAAPGTTLFAGIGVVLLIASATGLWVLPLNAWALVLLVLGLGLIGLEFVVPLHGGLTIGGMVLLIIGGLNLIDTTQAPGGGVSGWAVFGVSGGLAIGAGLSLWMALQSRKQPLKIGVNTLVGQVAEVRQRLDPEGIVFIDGALWRAVSEDGPVEVGEWVEIAAVHQLRLLVRPHTSVVQERN
jgi:membrane-bound serine protease (ClpP class)